MEIITLIGFIAIAGIAFFVGRNFSNSKTEKKQLEEALRVKTEELEAFHSKVNNHFEKTAELFNHVSDSYQSLYDHMAQSSNQLCASPTFQSLPTQSASKNDTTQPISNGGNASSSVITPQEAGPYSKLKRVSDKGTFDANRLYNAHDYRNKVEQEKEKVEEPDVNAPNYSTFADKQDNKVVEINSAKEDKDAHALDYAIKEKGVINHNSLDMEGVKNS